MNYGPLIFLAAFFALATSWFGLVLTPQMQIGHLQQTNSVPARDSYPVGRLGLARRGLEVYRANGCAYCHSQQVRQSGTLCDVVLTERGSNQEAVITALTNASSELAKAEPKEIVGGLPRHVLTEVPKHKADVTLRELKAAGAKAELWVIPVGADIARG